MTYKNLNFYTNFIFAFSNDIHSQISIVPDHYPKQIQNLDTNQQYQKNHLNPQLTYDCQHRHQIVYMKMVTTAIIVQVLYLKVMLAVTMVDV